MIQLNEETVRGTNVGEPLADLCRRTESLCRAIAPRDLKGLPLYIMPQSAVAETLGNAEECDGYTTPSLDLYLRESIGPRWRGRGPCIVVNDLMLKADGVDELEPFFQAIALHELAHVLERPLLYRPRSEAVPQRLSFETLVLAHAVSEPLTPSEQANERLAHDERFIRVVLHLCHRAERAGQRIAPSMVFSNRQYGLSHVHAYREALGNEVKRLANRAIREVLALPAPEAFSRLWADDHKHLFLKESS